jgi:hypothetical protein
MRRYCSHNLVSGAYEYTWATLLDHDGLVQNMQACPGIRSIEPADTRSGLREQIESQHVFLSEFG